MLDKAFGLKQIGEDMTKEPMVNLAGALILEAETEEEKMMAINLFGTTLVGLMSHAMAELLLSEQDFADLTATIAELIEIGEEAEEQN